MVGRVLESLSRRRERRAVAVLSKYPPQGIGLRNRFVQWRVRNAISTLRQAGERGAQRVQAWYEGGQPFLTGDQSWLNQVVQDARFDQNMVSRREMMRRMRNHAQDVPIHKSGLEISRQYEIGTHMPVVTSVATDSTGWCRRAETVFHEMCQTAGLNNETLFQLLSTAHPCKKNDGNRNKTRQSDIIYLQGDLNNGSNSRIV